MRLDEDIEDRPLTDKMSLEELMQRWTGCAEDETQVPTVPILEIEDFPPEQSNDAPQELDKYAHLISITTSYQWLVATLRNKLLLTTASTDVKQRIRAEVLSLLPKPGLIQRAAMTPPVEAIFEMDLMLNPADFAPGSIELSSVLTVTGSALDAQALTCGEYVQQTWPVTGIFMLQLLDDVLTLGPGQIATSCRLDGTNMTASRHNSAVKVQVFGTRDIIAEVAEQLCWMTATLCLSPINERLVSCSPRIHCVGQRAGISDAARKLDDLAMGKLVAQSQDSYSNSDIAPTINEIRGNMSIRFRITLEHQQSTGWAEPGSCWHYLFKHCVIVEGFPIRQRSERSLGLEIPLNMVARLIGTQHLHDFAGHTFLKSFSILLAPAEQMDNVLVWHLCHSNNEDPISYLDHGMSRLCNIGLDDLTERRHMVGWCSNIRNRCGSADSDYDVEKSMLPMVAPNGVLHNCNISFGKLITGGVDTKLTENHQPISASRRNYLDIFRYLESRFVLFWDTRDHRGWLINALRALLHLLRHSLKVDEEEGGALFVLNRQDFEEPSQPYTAKAAREFLSEPKNLSTKIAISSIGARQQEHEILADRMEQFYKVIEKCLIYQKQCATWARIPRSQLEGWDFVSLARKEDLIEPSKFILPSMGRGWVDLVRAVGAITLFGEGFGELLKPVAHTCPPLPCNKFYIATPISDIQQIMMMNRCDQRSTPRLLSRSPSLIWHCPSGSFRPNTCELHDESKPNHDVTQVVWSKDFASLLPQSSAPLNLRSHTNGAIIFGHSNTMQHYVADVGPPIPGVPPDPIKELELFEDSGIGSSLDETAEGTSSIPTTPSFHDSALASLTTPESRGQTYGNCNISGGHAIYGNFTGNLSVNQYFATTPNHNFGWSHTRSFIQPTDKLPLQAMHLIAGQRSHLDPTADISTMTQHRQQPEITNSFFHDAIVDEELQQAESRVRAMGLDECCQFCNFDLETLG